MVISARAALLAAGLVACIQRRRSGCLGASVSRAGLEASAELELEAPLRHSKASAELMLEECGRLGATLDVGVVDV